MRVHGRVRLGKEGVRPQPEPVPDEFKHNSNSFTGEFGLSSRCSNSSTDEFEHNPNPFTVGFGLSSGCSNSFTDEFEHNSNLFRTAENTPTIDLQLKPPPISSRQGGGRSSPVKKKRRAPFERSHGTALAGLGVCASSPSLRVNEGSRALMVSSFDVGVRLGDERGPRPPLPSCSRRPDQFGTAGCRRLLLSGFIPRLKNRRLRGALCPHPHAPRLVAALLILF